LGFGNFRLLLSFLRFGLPSLAPLCQVFSASDRWRKISTVGPPTRPKLAATSQKKNPQGPPDFFSTFVGRASGQLLGHRKLKTFSTRSNIIHLAFGYGVGPGLSWRAPGPEVRLVLGTFRPSALRWALSEPASVCFFLNSPPTIKACKASHWHEIVPVGVDGHTLIGRPPVSGTVVVVFLLLGRRFQAIFLIWLVGRMVGLGEGKA